MMAPARFNKRVYTPRSFARALRDVLAHLPDTAQAARGGRVGRAFAEKIMLAVTQVNGCVYCDYAHTRWALASGVSPEEIKRLAAGDLGGFAESEAVALMFAQHVAERGGQPNPTAWARLADYYGEETARDIMAYIRMIMMGNLLGNTSDYLIYRLTGRTPGGWLSRLDMARAAARPAPQSDE